MKKFLIIPLTAVLLFAFAPQKRTRVIFFGDSITRLGAERDKKSGTGYILKLDSMIKQGKKPDQYELIGSGIDGNKVYDLYLRLDNDVLAQNPDVVVIYIGVNDVWHKTLRGTGTDADKFEKFYQAILKKIRDRNIKAILCTPAVVGEKTDYSNPLDGDLNLYCNIIRDIAKKNDLPLIDLRKKCHDYLDKNNPDNKDRGVLTYDGVHMNDDGNQFLADAMWDAIRGLK
ncbi:MAG: G-D-S-L family lipolytic protein [Sphingobacteriales bacterium]|nr:G-D-S-L family lipolytic protein [Sphingobacteriales bacterium]